MIEYFYYIEGMKVSAMKISAVNSIGSDYRKMLRDLYTNFQGKNSTTNIINKKSEEIIVDDDQH